LINANGKHRNKIYDYQIIGAGIWGAAAVRELCDHGTTAIN